MSTIYIDMDDTTNYYRKNLLKYTRLHPELQYPQSVPGFYESIEPNVLGLNAIKELSDNGHDVWIATRPSYPNLHCYTEKAMWVKKWLGVEWLPKLILVPDKSLLIGDYLIDDYPWKSFTGRLMLFEDNWPEIIKEINARSNNELV